jgi:hypothetical protein
MIDYYLRSAVSGPITLEIHDPAGELIRRYSSDDRAPEVNPELLSVPAFWRRTPTPLSTTAGMHRWVWDLRPTPTGGGGRGGGGGSGRGVDTRVLPGRYSAKLIVEGKTYTQPLLVRADPQTQITPASAKATQTKFSKTGWASHTADSPSESTSLRLNLNHLPDWRSRRCVYHPDRCASSTARIMHRQSDCRRLRARREVHALQHRTAGVRFRYSPSLAAG